MEVLVGEVGRWSLGELTGGSGAANKENAILLVGLEPLGHRSHRDAGGEKIENLCPNPFSRSVTTNVKTSAQEPDDQASSGNKLRVEAEDHYRENLKRVPVLKNLELGY